MELNDIQIQVEGSSAVVTFEQRYQTANHRDLGVKTLHLHHDDDRWTIIKENWHPIPTQG